MPTRRRIGTTAASALLALAAVGLLQTPAQAATPVKISLIHYNSPGTDNRSNASLNGEYVVLKNATTRSQRVTGWTLRDAAGHVYRFPTTTVAAGRTVTVRTGKGTNSATTRYWGSGNYIWNNDRDTAYLRNAAGRLLSTCAYHSTSVASKTC